MQYGTCNALFIVFKALSDGNSPYIFQNFKLHNVSLFTIYDRMYYDMKLILKQSLANPLQLLHAGLE